MKHWLLAIGLMVFSPFVSAFAEDMVDLKSVEALEEEAAVADFFGLSTVSLRDHDCGRWGCDRRPPRRPGRPPRPNPPRRGYICYAEDIFRQVYSGRSIWPDRAQEEALSNCEWESGRRCRPMGCRAF